MKNLLDDFLSGDEHMQLQPLRIGDLEARIPIIQGGMGVGISLSSLAGAVAKEGAIGVISAAQPGYDDPDFLKNPVEANLRALSYHIKRAKELSNNGIIGVNIMCAGKNYEEYVQCCIDNHADLIISGAGLPIKLPELIGDADIKFAPIVSSLKAAKVLFKMWDRRYHKVADLVVIEGPKAGGHLGFSKEELERAMQPDYDFDTEIRAIIEYVKSFEEKYNREIPIVFGGGVYDRADIDHYLSLGLSGVQMATRFVVTEECDADPKFKEAYLQAKKEDIVIVQSPVGMPGRAALTPYTKQRMVEREKITHCFRCLEHCDPATTPYCITMALVRAVQGDIDNSLVFCGESAYRLQNMTTVKALLEELTEE